MSSAIVVPAVATAPSRRRTPRAAAARWRTRVSRERVLLAFERRQRQQVVDEALHAPRLLRHQLQVARALARLELEVLQRLEEAGDDGQRRLELVRDVGDEVAAHPRDRLELRDVAADQQPLVDAERHDLDRQRRSRLAQRVDDHGVGEIARLEIADDLRLAHEVEQRPARCPSRDRGRGAPAPARSPTGCGSPRRGSPCRREAPRRRCGSARSSCARSRWCSVRARTRR